MNYLKLLLFVIIFYCNNALSCTGGTSAGVLTPTTSYQTVNLVNGNYYSISVVSCDSYTFTFCDNGGSASYDTQITILDAAGTTELAYADDQCGVQSSISWVASFTGTIRVLVSKYNCNNDLSTSATLAYKYTPKTGDYCIADDATYITVGGQSCIQLTAEVNDQTGCAWNDDLVDFNQSFTLNLDYYFGNNVNGADGTTFTFHPNMSTTCGTSGGEIGAGGIANSLIVEFDTYDNDFPTHAVDISADHIAVETDGSLLNSSHYAGPVAALASLANIDDGATHNVQISWNATTYDLKIYFDGSLRLTANGDFVNTVFGGDNTVYWGATGATGGLNNQQYFCPNTVIVLPLDLISFSSECVENKNYIQWTTASESHVDYFLVESTTDGIIYQTMGEVNALGNTDQARQYRLEYTPPATGTEYYRLKMVDEDGNFKVTNLILGNNCSYEYLLQNYTFTNGQLLFNVTEENTIYKLFTITGQEIVPMQYCNEQKSQNIILTNTSQGVYLLSIESNDGSKKEIHRIFHTRN